MEWEVPPAGDARGPSGRTSRVKAWASSGYGRVIVFACGSLYFIVSLAAAVNWSLWRHDAARSSAKNHSDRRKLLAVVVPTHAGDIEDAVAAISSWPVSCSAATLHRMQLVLYYSGGVGDAAWSDEIIEVVAQTGGRCFERTRVIFANLDPKVRVCQVLGQQCPLSRASRRFLVLCCLSPCLKEYLGDSASRQQLSLP